MTLFHLASLILFADAAPANPTYLGLYLQGNKIGYSSFVSVPTIYLGQRSIRNDGTTMMDAGLLGTPLKIQMISSTWTDSNGRPQRMSFLMSSSGRTQKVEAKFGSKFVDASIDNSGQKSTKRLVMPNGAQIVDDPMTLVISGAMKIGTSRTFYVLDPSTVSLVRNDVKFIGQTTVDVKGHNYKANSIDITDPQATMHVFIDMKGELLRVEGPMGIEMLPISRTEALGKSAKYTPAVDLAFSTSLKTDRPILDPAHLKELKLRVEGKNLKSIPSGEFQTAAQEAHSWTIDIHPPQISVDRGMTIAEAAATEPLWTKPTMNLPSNSPRFISLAKKITQGERQVQKAAFAIRQYVYETMRPNAGIGVLRDANEVLDSKEGVCRDYAVLTVTLLRAAHIPARLASGIVNWDGTFYYHAWAEAWDGHHWIGIDSTSEDNQISAAHVKLGEGNVEEAFAFTFLDRAKISVLNSTKE